MRFANARNKTQFSEIKERRVKKLALISAILLLSGVTANAGPHDDVDNIGRCLVFSYVRAGLDGQKDIPQSLKAGMSFLMSEYEMRAATVGLGEKERQAFIVQSLEEQNRVAKVDGVDALESRYKTLCTNVAAALSSELKAKGSKSKP